MIGDGVSPKAVIGQGNKFGHGVLVGDDVVIGDNNTFGDYAVVKGRTQIGDNNYIGDHTTLGRIPTNSNRRYEFQDGPESYERFGKISIGSENVIREFTNVGLPTGEQTFIGDQCYIMPHCHVAHDVHLENRVILSDHCSPGGHNRIMQGANLGKGAKIHQRVVIGQYAMIGMGSVVLRSVLPGATVAGNPARHLGANLVGMQRNGLSDHDAESIASALKAETPIDLSSAELTPKAEETVQRFLQMLSAHGRDMRTVPEIHTSDD